MTKEERRQQMPICAAFVDELIAVFGPDQVRVLYARENDVEFGDPAELIRDRVRAER